MISVSITTWGFIPLGALPQGILADLFGALAVVASAAIICAAALAAMGLWERRLREI